MDLDRHLFALIAPLGLGDEIMKGARITSISTELGLRVTVETAGAETHLEIARVEDGGRFAARSRRLLFRYRDGAGLRHVDPALGLSLCRALAARAEVHEDDVLLAIEKEAAEALETEDFGARIREVRVSKLLSAQGAPSERHHTLSPYVGCLVGCRFCYAQSRVAEPRRLQRLPELPWGSFVDARVNAAEVLSRELDELPAWPVKFCPIVSDPYQPVERRFFLTRSCLEVLGKARVVRPVLVLTRSTLIMRDLEVLTKMPRAMVGMSIPTLDDDVRRHFEPRSASIAERLSILETFSKASVETFAVAQPILPGSIPGLADALARCVRSVSIDVLRGTFGAEAEFSDPRYEVARDEGWQRAAAEELSAELQTRGVAVWSGELPPSLTSRE